MKIEILDQTHGPDIIEGHLGGCSIGGDGGTYYPIMWQKLIEEYYIKSVLDVGCGRGYSSKYFQSMGCQILGIDGSQEAKKISLIPNNFILNDYEKGSALTNKNLFFDLCWSCEFVEHVWEKYSQNFINDFKKCRYLAMTFAAPGQTGHHHVNEQSEEYWIQKIEANGFQFLDTETKKLKKYSEIDRNERMKIPNVPYFISHFVERGLFFKNLNIK